MCICRSCHSELASWSFSWTRNMNNFAQNCVQNERKTQKSTSNNKVNILRKLEMCECVCAWREIYIARRWNALQLRMCVCVYIWWVLCGNFADVAKTMIMMATLLQQACEATHRGARGNLKLSVLIVAALFKVLFSVFLCWLIAKHNLINVSQFRGGTAKCLQKAAMAATVCTVECAW